MNKQIEDLKKRIAAAAVNIALLAGEAFVVGETETHIELDQASVELFGIVKSLTKIAANVGD